MKDKLCIAQLKKSIRYSDFKQMAVDETLTMHEKIGFPSHYREGKEEAIINDILSKLTNLKEKKCKILDIGAGCGALALKLIDLCRSHGHKLILIDSREMLDHLPDESFIKKVTAQYPLKCENLITENQGEMDVILSYSVLQYIFIEGNIYNFLDQSLSLLAEGGQLLLGDIPNASKRKRFLSSSTGIQYHKENYDTSDNPEINHYAINYDQIDDAILLGIMMRSRSAGFDAYLLPQNKDLPMANRREDLLIVRP